MNPETLEAYSNQSKLKQVAMTETSILSPEAKMPITWLFTNLYTLYHVAHTVLKLSLWSQG